MKEHTIHGVAIELPIRNEAEQLAADTLRTFFSELPTRDIRDYLERVREIIAPAGLYAGTGGSHIWICRESDKISFDNKVDAGENPQSINIPRWAYIGEEETAKSWQRSADRKNIEQAPIYETVEGLQVWVSGEVIIEGTRHAVKNKMVACDRGLNSRSWNTTEEKQRCAICFKESNIIHQNHNKDMEFFQNLAGITDKVGVTLRIQSINGELAVAVIPDTLKDIKSLDITGTPAELDEGFFDLIRQPLKIATGLRSNVDEATKSFEAAAGTAQPAAPTTAAPTDGKAKDEKKTRTRKQQKDETPAQEQPAAPVEQNAEEQTGQIKELLTDAAESETQQLPGNEPAEDAAPRVTNDEIKAMMEGAADTAQLRNIHEAYEEAISASELLTRVFHTRHDELIIPDPSMQPVVTEELPQAQPVKPAAPKPGPPKPGIPKPALTAAPPQEEADAGLFNQEAAGTDHAQQPGASL